MATIVLIKSRISMIYRSCVVCRFESRMNLTMRGFCPGDIKTMEGSFDNQYFIDGYKNRKAHWRGLGKSHIFYLPMTKTWKLESFYEKEEYALFESDDSQPGSFYPLGRYSGFSIRKG